MRWPFAKYVGCGNDFILFDNRHGTFPFSSSNLFPSLCDRQKGIGADGVLLLENSLVADFRMRIFNADGSEAEMCGNGLRCFVKWLTFLGFDGPLFQIEVMHHVLTASLVENDVCINMSHPTTIQWNIPLLYENRLLHVHHLDTGVPHTVVFMPTIELNEAEFMQLGRYLRYHSLWQPKGTNVTLAQQIGSDRFKIRTYERGVEGETLACGTGATAAALAAAYHYQLLNPLYMETRSGEDLKIGFIQQQQNFSHVTLTGPAQCTFQGAIDLENTEISSFSIACNSNNSVKS